MANVNAPFGLRPVKTLSGAPWNGAVNFYFATGATGVIAPGDPVVNRGTCNTSEFMGFAPGTLPEVGIASAGASNVISGVCTMVLPVTNASLPYRETSTDRIIAVADDPQLIFQVQENAGGSAFAAIDAGRFAVLAAGTASTVTGQSQWVIDTTTASNTTVTFQVMLMRYANVPTNAIGQYAIWEVMLLNAQLAALANAGRFTAV